MLSKAQGGREFNYRLGRYGPGVRDAEASPVAIAVADPFDGCEDKAYKVSKGRMSRARDERSVGGTCQQGGDTAPWFAASVR